MRHSNLNRTLLILALVVLTAVSSLGNDYIPGKLFIKFKPGYEPAEDDGVISGIPDLDTHLLVNGLHKREHPFSFLSKSDTHGVKRWRCFYLNENADIEALAARVMSIDGIESACVEPVRTLSITKTSGGGSSRSLDFFPNDPYYPLQWAYPNISAPAAWDITTGDPDVIIAIADNGVDWDHPDLAANIWINPGEIPGNGFDDDGHGYIDDIRGWDFIGWDNDPSVDSDSAYQNIFHGTHVAGISCGVMNNGRGITGLAPGCKIMPLKVGYGGWIESTAAALAITYAYEMGAKVVNCSFGGLGSFGPEQDAINTAYEGGTLTVAAAGNDGAVDPNQYPAAYPNVLAVAWTEPMNIVSYNSNTADWVDVCAPGGDIYSTWVSNSAQPGYASASGTSMASPLAAGLAGLVYSIYPEWDARQVTLKIKNTCDNIYGFNPGYEGKLGAGRINAFRSVGEPIPGIRFDSFIIDDSQYGNGDGVLNANETVDLIVTLSNIFEEAGGVTGVLSTTHLNVSILVSESEFGDIPMNSSKDNSASPFQVQVGSLPPAELIHFTLEVSTDLGYEFNLWFEVMVSPPYSTHNIGNVTATITSFGAIGYNKDPYNVYNQQQIGEGFCYPALGGNSLYHGTLLLGNSSTQVCDALLTYQWPSLDFEWESSSTVNMHPGTIADQESETYYYDDDIFLPAEIQVQQLTYAWSEEGYEDFIIMDFVFTNGGGADLNGCYAAVYLDWDISDADFNSAGYDNTHELGYMWGESSAYFGITTLSAAPNSYYKINLNIYNPSDLNDANLFSFMTSGISSQVGSNNDYAHLISIGPFDLPVGGSYIFGAAILGGDDLNDLKANSDSAQVKYNLLHGVISAGISPFNNKISISLIHPNPFNPMTVISFEIKMAGIVKLTVFDIQGREVRSLLNNYQSAGSHSVLFDGGDLPSGMYFTRLETNGCAQTQKMLMIK